MPGPPGQRPQSRALNVTARELLGDAGELARITTHGRDFRTQAHRHHDQQRGLENHVSRVYEHNTVTGVGGKYPHRGARALHEIEHEVVQSNHAEPGHERHPVR